MTPKNLYFRGFGAAVNHHSVATSTILCLSPRVTTENGDYSDIMMGIFVVANLEKLCC